jgi:hypothetical protein
LVRTTNPGDPVTFTLQVANDNLQRSNAALVKRIEALEARLKAANNNHAAGPKRSRRRSGAYKAAHP